MCLAGSAITAPGQTLQCLLSLGGADISVGANGLLEYSQGHAGGDEGTISDGTDKDAAGIFMVDQRRVCICI